MLSAVALLRLESAHAASLSLWSASLTRPLDFCHSRKKKVRLTVLALLYSSRNGLVLAVNDLELVPVCFCLDATEMLYSA